MAAQRFNSYSLRDSSIIIGNEILSGFDEDDVITISFPNPLYEEHRGADGEWTRNEHPHAFEADVQISIGQKSKSNAGLFVQILADKLTNAATFPIAITNADGTGGAAPVAYHNQIPEAAYGRNATARQFNLKCPQFIPKAEGL
jgi:hypothetical protein